MGFSILGPMRLPAHWPGLFCCLALVITPAMFLASGMASADPADTAVPPDILVLKNGHKIQGTIIEQNDKKVILQLIDGKKRVFKRSEIKAIQAAPEPELPKPKPTVTETESESAPPPPPPPPSEWTHPGPVHFGVGLQLGILKAISIGYDLGVHVAIDVPLSSAWYLRIDPSFSAMSRSTKSTEVQQIAVAPDGTPLPPAYDTVANKVQAYSFELRPAIGVDYLGGTLTSRLGGIIGFMTGSTSAAQCPTQGASGLVVGGTLTPLAARLTSSKALELGLNLDLEELHVPRCGYASPPSGAIQVGYGSTVSFVPSTVGISALGGAASLELTYLFW